MTNIANETIKAMRIAISQNNVDEVQYLLDVNDGLLDLSLMPFGTWLHVAVLDELPEMIKLFINLGIDVNKKAGLRKAGPLTEAAFKGNVEIVKLLLSKGARIEVDTFRANPLFAAIYNGHMNVVKLLVEAGIDLSATYALGELDEVDAYEYARQYGQKEIADYLKEKMGK